jgi:16S rRNA (guanine966-N2)-methyltransferase
MRVIAGTFKGRRLSAPSWQGLRPTSDKLRETLFNVLASRVSGARVLDGFAGTGAVGIEALSRGARHVTFVDDDRRAAALILANLASLGVQDGYAIIRDGVERAARRLAGRERFDVIVLDPPYDYRGANRAVAAMADIIEPHGVLVIEHAARRTPEPTAGFTHMRTIRSGDSALSLFTPRS